MSAPMVRALLAGTKTQTRRPVKPQPAGQVTGCHQFSGPKLRSDGIVHDHNARLDGWQWVNCDDGLQAFRCPYGQPGEWLWVRETFYCDCCFYPEGVPDSCQWREIDGKRVPIPLEEKRAGMLESMYYKADGEPEWEGAEGRTPWRPSIHMPRWASRITLEITGVRVERLQGISEADAIAEGVERTATGDGWRRYCAPPMELAGVSPCTTARDSYRSLWDFVNGPGSWNANPWVWAVQFRVDSAGEAPLRLPAPRRS